MLFMRLNSSAKKDFQSCQWNISTMMTASLPLDDFSTILDKSENESYLRYLNWLTIGPGPQSVFQHYCHIMRFSFHDFKKFSFFFWDLLDWLLVILVCSGKASDVIDLSFCRLTSPLLVRHQHFIPLFDKFELIGAAVPNKLNLSLNPPFSVIQNIFKKYIWHWVLCLYCQILGNIEA